MTPLRRVEKMVGDQWIVVRMSEISNGDLFKLFESDTGEQVGGVWAAKSDAYDTNGVWGVEADEHKYTHD